MNIPCYGVMWNKKEQCKQCPYADYCRSYIEETKTHCEYTTKDEFADIGNVYEWQKQHNTSGLLIAELLRLTDFNALKFFVVICRLGNLTYKEIGALIGVTDVQVFKYCQTMPQQLKKYLKHKTCTMLEIQEAFKNYKQPKLPKQYFGNIYEKIIQMQFADIGKF